MELRNFINDLWTMRENDTLHADVSGLMDEHHLTTYDNQGKSVKTQSLKNFLNTINGTGTVKFFLLKKNFGFISPDDDTLGDIFVHTNSISLEVAKKLQSNSKVSFIAEPSPKGLRAISIELEEDEDASENSFFHETGDSDETV